MYRFERSTNVPRSIEETFAFFSDARNLERLTPPSLHFKFIAEPPTPLFPGARIDYSLRLYGVPIRWRTRIEQWGPPHRFSDAQERGPYASWIHTHTFERNGRDCTMMRDFVEYELPFGPLGAIAKHLFVARQLRAIFDYRAVRMAEIFAP